MDTSCDIPDILVIIPTRNRSSHLRDCIAAMLDTAKGNFDMMVVTQGGGMIAAVNSVPMDLLARYKIFSVRDDDIRVKSKGWDEIVRNRLAGKTGIVYGPDSKWGKNLACQFYATTDIPMALGYIAPKWSRNYALDTLYDALGRKLDILEYVPELTADHLKRESGLSPMDKLYREYSASHLSDAARWEKYRATDFLRDVEKVKHLLEPKIRRFYSQGGEDKWIYDNHWIPARGIYVDIGAAHPEKESNTALLRDLGWTGIQVDAAAAYKSLWEAKGLELIPAVVWNKPRTRFYIDSREPNYSKIDIKGECAVCVTLEDLLISRGIGKVDVLSVDVEGAEFEVVSSLDFSLHQPGVIIWEYRTLGVINERLSPFLEARGYQKVHTTRWNHIHVHTAFRPA